jgi:hypothetical protein
VAKPEEAAERQRYTDEAFVFQAEKREKDSRKDYSGIATSLGS